MAIPLSPLHFDLADMRARLGGDDELIEVLFGLFLEDYAAILGALDTAVKIRDVDAVRRGSHQLKGSAGNLSASAVVAAAARLESLAEQRDETAFDAQFAALAVEVNALVTELRGSSPGRQ